MSDDVDADADRQPVAAAREQRGFQQDAGELGAVGEHVVRPFQLEAAALSSAAIDADADPASRRHRGERIGERQTGDEAERRRELELAGAGEQQRRGQIAVRRLPDAAASAAAALLAFRDDPKLAGIAAARALERHSVGRADRLVRLKPVPVEGRSRRQLKSHQKNVLAAASAIWPIGLPIST
jgi:hypothetical protein